MRNTLQLTNDQYLDEICYRPPFTDAGNQFSFQCMQLKNDGDVNTMLMCNVNTRVFARLSYYLPLVEHRMIY